MNYNDLLKAHAILELISRGDKSYWDFYGREVWSLNNLNVQVVKDHILKFLNKWRSRISYQVAPSLHSKLLTCKVHIDKLGKASLRECDFQTVSTEIKQIFNELEPVIGSTGTSKVLHMTKPNLFVMWDRAIRKDFGYRHGLSSEYITFMMEMQNRAIAVVKSYLEVHEDINSYAEAEKAIEKTCNGKTLAKLVDEYNWVHAHCDAKPKLLCPHCKKTIELGV